MAEDNIVLSLMPMKGDLDDNHTINIVDVRLLLQEFLNSNYGTEWSDDDLYIMDINKDETVDVLDVRLLLQMVINP